MKSIDQQVLWDALEPLAARAWHAVRVDAANETSVHAAKLGAPFVVARATHAVLSAQLADGRA